MLQFLLTNYTLPGMQLYHSSVIRARDYIILLFLPNNTVCTTDPDWPAQLMFIRFSQAHWEALFYQTIINLFYTTEEEETLFCVLDIDPDF